MSHTREPWGYDGHSGIGAIDSDQFNGGYPTAEVMDQEMKDLMRFNECVMDNEGYDVPKERMKRLAEIGLLRRVTANIYEHTTFGLSIINGDFLQKSEIVKQRDELLAAAEAVEINAEECNDFDDCIGMFVPIDAYHGLTEVIERLKGETK